MLLIPGGIVIKDVKSDLFGEGEFFEKRLFTILPGEPNAVCDQRRIG